MLHKKERQIQSTRKVLHLLSTNDEVACFQQTEAGIKLSIHNVVVSGLDTAIKDKVGDQPFLSDK